MLEQDQIVEAPPILRTKNAPEFSLPPRRESTKMVRIYPIRAEWSNGHLIELLNSLLSQNQTSVEVLFVANMGDKLSDLYAKKPGTPFLENSVDGQYQLTTNPKTESGKKALRLLHDTMTSSRFLSTLILIQSDTISDQERESLVERTSAEFPQCEEVLRKAASNNAVRLGLVDATLWNPSQEYEGEGTRTVPIATMRTLGLDVTSLRYGETSPDIPVIFGDVDAVDDGEFHNKIVSLFEKHTFLKYFFIPLGYKPGLEDSLQFASSPEQSLARVINYAYGGHQSPQIAARLSVLEELGEVGDYTNQTGFQGGEDRDTGDRLAYYFGQLHYGYAFNAGMTVQWPMVLTTNRATGFTDSVIDKTALALKLYAPDLDNSNPDYDQIRTEALRRLETQRRSEPPIFIPLNDSIRKFSKLLDHIRQRADLLDDDQKQAAVEKFNEYRRFMEKRVRGMIRLNRVVTELLLQLNDRKLITINDGVIKFDRAKVKHFLESTQLQMTRALVPELREKAVQQVLLMLNHESGILHFLNKHPSLVDWAKQYLNQLSNNEPHTALTYSNEASEMAFQYALVQYLGNLPTESAGLYEVATPNYQDQLESFDSTYFRLMTDAMSLGLIHTLFFEAESVREVKQPFSNTSWPSEVSAQLTTGAVAPNLAPPAQRREWLRSIINA